MRALRAIQDFFHKSSAFKQSRKVHYTEFREGHCSFWIVLPPSFWRTWIINIGMGGISVDPDHSYRWFGLIREIGRKPGHNGFPETPPPYVEIRATHDPRWFEEVA